MNAVDKKFKLLLDKIRLLNFSLEETKLVKQAYNFAFKKHSEQLRKSGEPYIIHPLEAAILLAEWKMDVNTIITGLLHDVLEDTDCTEEEMTKKFGQDITNMTKIVSKVSRISDKNRSDSLVKSDNNEYLIKVLMSVSTDIRPMMVKIADRTHNMLTISHLKKEKQEKIANETFNIYANIAGRLGMYHQKTLLLDLSFSILEPIKYQKTKEKLDELIIANKERLSSLKEEIADILRKAEINFSIIERIKGIYSTYKKNERGINIKDIHDIFALRIIGDFNELKCYEILGLIHLNFSQIPNAFKDYISNPKLNMYQSLHTTITYKRMFVEIQIRNKLMDNVANLGIASHWSYKEVDDQTKIIQDSLMKDIIDKKESEVIQKLKYISKTKIFDVMLTNNNKWYIMPENSTAMDLAFQYNPNKVIYISQITKDGLSIPLYYNLQKDDIITIDYSDEVKASREWIDYSSNDEFKQTITNLFPDQTNENQEQEFNNYLKKEIKNELVSAVIMKKRLELLERENLSDFLDYYFVDKKINFEILAPYFSTNNRKWKKAFEFLSSVDSKNTLESFNIKNIPGVNFQKIIYSNCCSKVWGMEIIGNLIRNVLYIHRFDCTQINKNKKIYMLQWNNEKLKEFPQLFQLSFTVNYYKKVMRNNKIIFVITSRGFEIVTISTKMDKFKKIGSLKISILAKEFASVKKLFDDIKNRLDIISIELN